MSTLRENAQFIDELRQHYRRLDGLLVKHRDRLPADEIWLFNAPVIALRKLLFGGHEDPNPRAAGAASSLRPLRAEPAHVTSATYSDLRRHAESHCPSCVSAVDLFWRELRSVRAEVGACVGCGANPPLPDCPRSIARDAPTAPMSVHDPAEDLEVIP